MKFMAVVGYILAVLSLVGGLIISTDGNLPMQGLSGLLAGIAGAVLFALPSTALIGIVQIRALLKASKLSDAASGTQVSYNRPGQPW